MTALGLTLNVVGLAAPEADLSGTPAGWLSSLAGVGGTLAYGAGTLYQNKRMRHQR